eukprot:2483411-Prymnesium_polylepis.1
MRPHVSERAEAHLILAEGVAEVDCEGAYADDDRGEDEGDGQRDGPRSHRHEGVHDEQAVGESKGTAPAGARRAWAHEACVCDRGACVSCVPLSHAACACGPRRQHLHLERVEHHATLAAELERLLAEEGHGVLLPKRRLHARTDAGAEPGTAGVELAAAAAALLGVAPMVELLLHLPERLGRCEECLHAAVVGEHVRLVHSEQLLLDDRIPLVVVDAGAAALRLVQRVVDQVHTGEHVPHRVPPAVAFGVVTRHGA